jgi:hypothetical protein
MLLVVVEPGVFALFYFLLLFTHSLSYNFYIFSSGVLPPASFSVSQVLPILTGEP